MALDTVYQLICNRYHRNVATPHEELPLVGGNLLSLPPFKVVGFPEANCEKILARARERYVVNREKILKRKQAWYKAHPEAGVHQRNKRRALKNNSPRNDLTRQQWQDIQAAQNHCCAYCKKRCKGRLTQDHITPLSKGGSHTLHNVIAACKSCNSRKWTRDVLNPVQPLLL